MRMSCRPLRSLALGLSLIGVLALGGCDSGGGDGGGSAPAAFTFTGQASYVTISDTGAVTRTAMPTLPVTPLPGQDPIPLQPGGTPAVPALTVPTGTLMGLVRQDFIELTFTTPLRASTIRSATGGIDGIVLTREDPATRLQIVQNYLLDSAGVLDAANAFTPEGAAPQVLRLYAPGTDNLLSTQDAFPDGAYTVRFNSVLRSSTGAAFVNSPGSSANDFLPEIGFSVGTDTIPLTLRTSPTVNCVAGGATAPLSQDPAIALNSEITLDFNKPVAFETLVGAANLTTLDPFCTVPFTLAAGNCNAAGGAANIFGVDIGDLYVGLRTPLDPVSGLADPPPPNLAVIAYMPDAIARPSRVRIRFIDGTTAVGTETLPNGPFQNYASNSARTELQIPTNDPARIAAATAAGQARPILTLPGRLSVSGSLPGYVPSANFATDPLAMLIEVVVAGRMTADPTMGGCSMPAMTAASRNGQAFNFCTGGATPLQDFYFQSAYQAGVALARNSSVPEISIVLQPSFPGLAALNHSGMTTPLCGFPDSTVPVAGGGTFIGNIALLPNSLRNPNVLGTPLDVEFGRYVGPVQNIFAAPRRNTIPPAPNNIVDLGIPDGQNATSPDSLLGLLLGNGCGNPPTPIPQPYGSFLYVVDGDRDQLRVFNSYNFTPITNIQGVRSPAGLGIDAAMTRLYVSNFDDSSLQVIDTVPQSSQFHTVVGSIGVDSGPRAVSVQGTNESVWVACFGANSLVRVNPAGLTFRARFRDPSIIGPEDVFVTERMLGMGLTNAFSVFVPCSGSNSIVIYESESPAVAENGINGLVKSVRPGFRTPRGGTWNWLNYLAPAENRGPGLFFANSSGTTVDELAMTSFTLGPPVGFPGPPGTRVYPVVRSIQPPGNATIPSTAQPSDVSADVFSSLPGVLLQNGGSPNKAFRDGGGANNGAQGIVITYPGIGAISVVQNLGSVHIRQIVVPGCQALHSYYDQ